MKVLIYFAAINICLADIFETLNNANKIDEVIPQEAKQFYQGLTQSDKNVLTDLIHNLNNYTSSDDILADLKGKSSFLFDKASTFILSFKSIFGNLKEQSQDFVKECLQTAQSIFSSGLNMSNIRSQLGTIIHKYKVLNEETKTDLELAFPKIAAIYSNPIVKTILESVLGINFDDESPQPTTLIHPNPTNPPKSTQQTSFDSGNDVIEEKFERKKVE
uniref:Fatty-acid and retinol-binding protein 1 n=1 Tax=Rhabditophanes sp. KR3021 TaxID=114890 RepID=A0AC35TIQ8_9BILA